MMPPNVAQTHSRILEKFRAAADNGSTKQLEQVAAEEAQCLAELKECANGTHEKALYNFLRDSYKHHLKIIRQKEKANG